MKITPTPYSGITIHYLTYRPRPIACGSMPSKWLEGDKWYGNYTGNKYKVTCKRCLRLYPINRYSKLYKEEVR